MELSAWPFVVLIFGLVALFRFTPQIGRLIDRIRSVDKSGVKTDLTLQTPTDASVITEKLSASDELQRTFDNELLIQRENQIREELNKLTFKEVTEREKFLIKFLAAASLKSDFEEAYGGIMGSQLTALQVLNPAGDAGMDPESLRPIYESAMAEYSISHEEFPFEHWLKFLIIRELIAYENNVIHVTLKGREFLKYLIQIGRRLTRAG